MSHEQAPVDAFVCLSTFLRDHEASDMELTALAAVYQTLHQVLQAPKDRNIRVLFDWPSDVNTSRQDSAPNTGNPDDAVH
jgi:hypothetical protein